ncbi:MAG TPA: hypothetical protein VHV10_20090 [Ktedonobacteraceae bacterium]|jgi:hypothetical protein|nr:hypothetical protein [Ktedonobacteraceae bacterium]
MRQERIRKEHPASETAKHEGVPCSHEELYNYAQQEIAQHSAQAAESARRLQEWDDEQHRIARESK